MNEQPPQFLVIGLEVLVTGHDNKQHRAKITEVLHPRAARVESLDGQNSAVSEYSETGEVNTFSFPSSAKASAEDGKTIRGKQKE
jgi:hypothetical protein